MVIDSYLIIQTVCLAVFFGVLELGYFIFGKKQREAEKLIHEVHEKQGVKSITRWTLFKQKMMNSSLFITYSDWLKEQMSLAWNEEETVDDIVRTQLITSAVGLIITVMLFMIAPVYVAIIVLILFLITVSYPALKYKNIVDSKNKQFDKELPGFINKTIMVLRVGVTIDNAFGYGLQSMQPSLTRKEFEKLVAEMKVHGDDIQKVFMNLNKRVQTEECERFCNIIISGLKNGNKMSDILESEYQRISDNQLSEMKKQAESKKTLATVVNIILIFIPAVLLLVIPMMRIGELA